MKNYTITVNGVAYNVTVEENTSQPQTQPQMSIPTPAPAPVQPVKPSATSGAKGSVTVEAPMPGNILEIKTSVGSKVSAGDVIIVLEAMKMENEIVSPSDGEIASVEVNKGDTVEAGQLLITIN